METKDFDGWSNLKKRLDQNQRLPTFREREIWWCHIGLNIGHEENGKGKEFIRPILIIRKFNNHLFLGVPLTTQKKEKHYYHHITFKEKEQCVITSQIRIMEAMRLSDKMGQLSESHFNEIREVIKKMI